MLMARVCALGCASNSLLASSAPNGIKPRTSAPFTRIFGPLENRNRAHTNATPNSCLLHWGLKQTTA